MQVDMSISNNFGAVRGESFYSAARNLLARNYGLYAIMW